MDEFDSQNEILTERETKLAKPKMYRVLLHNDPYTLRELVVIILQSVFRKSESESTRIMLEAHTKGIAAVGIYTREIAKDCIDMVEKMAEQFACPLRCSMEEVEI